MSSISWVIATLICTFAIVVGYAVIRRFFPANKLPQGEAQQVSAHLRAELQFLREEVERQVIVRLTEERENLREAREREHRLREEQRDLREEMNRLVIARLKEEQENLRQAKERENRLREEQGELLDKVMRLRESRLEEEIFRLRDEIELLRKSHVEAASLRTVLHAMQERMNQMSAELRSNLSEVPPRISQWSAESESSSSTKLQPGVNDKLLPRGATDELPSGLIIDNVHFTLTAPAQLPKAQASEIHFWLHSQNQRTTVLELAHHIQIPRGTDLSLASAGPYPLGRGSRITVSFKVAGLVCRNNHQSIIWTGEIGHSGFVVEVPPDASLGTHIGTASIRLNGCQIAKISFVLNVGRERGEFTEIPSTTQHHRSAFASYASEDRAEVVRCIQAMETAYKGLRVFLDVVNIRSGETWEQRLNTEIANADIFYLFWCRHAAASEWVKKEWQLALAKKGMDFIDPVPLEEPANAPPPPELAEKHFNDPKLSFFKAAGGTH